MPISAASFQIANRVVFESRILPETGTIEQEGTNQQDRLEHPTVLTIPYKRLYNYNYGSVRLHDGLVNLQFAKSNAYKGGLQGIPPAYYLVHWGSRQYLIPPDQIIEFCNDVDGGLELSNSSRSTRHLLRDDAVGSNLEVQPDVPAKFRPYLRPVPLGCRIVSVEQTSVEDIPHTDYKTRVTRVTLLPSGQRWTEISC